MHLPAITTPRLNMRDWAPVLADPARRAWLVAALTPLLTPQVLAPLPPSLALQGVDVSGWIAARAEECRVMLVLCRDSARDDALAGLVLLAGDRARGLHLGYLLGQRHWGQGLATELVSGLVSGLSEAGPVTLRAGVGRDNPASARVLQKAGFQRVAERSDIWTDHFIRRIG
ncbi:GNAT family N-acetyltransferase [Pseudooceanicola aestuarii]|uniref:GNAT family N-acetyltransferase n=1 Tax=Pseudooceanicola aestuarii TaxID=2697319 RepID=UPI0013D24340|nr:GNAT family N-acetyltransferase [Pseudooceanicola aestuarii]